MEKRWEIIKHDRAVAAKLADETGLRQLTAALLISRGIDTEEKVRKFVTPSLDQLHDPSLLLGMEKAVKRIMLAVQNGEKILIWGDYDVDGTTGTVLLRCLMRILGANSEFHIPDRFSEGYGLNIPMLQEAKARGCTLGITVDCGIRAFEALAWAKDNGLDMIVTDHHLSDEQQGQPPAYAVINPNQPDCAYPDKDLAGVGVAYKVAQAVLREIGKEEKASSFLKMAAIGTVADLMDLGGENRAIVSLGLRDLTATRNLGLKALMEAADCRSDMTSFHIGYRIGPRINAAGRMDNAKQVVELFEAESFDEARKIAAALDSRNRERQQMQQEITELALLEAAEKGQEKFVVVSGEGWHRGVIGLAASRIADRLYRPAIVLSTKNGVAHGSGRSVGNYHLLNALEGCSDLFDQFGGHAAAAGMKLSSDKIPELSRRLSEHAEKTLTDEDLVPDLQIDAAVSTATLSLELVRELRLLEPFGMGNPKPVFATDGLILRFEPTVIKDKHLKLHLGDSEGRRFEAIWWDGVERSMRQTLRQGSRIELAYTATENVWQGNSRLQLVVEDLREHN
ncbi:MAG: single-stranded-DNA-specific exonuclease RecJ [Acidobacteria bacterium]|nr:single-stranded-DNA-specific exonuclease RecJ [Acidobacteriota bacterium]